MKKLVECSNDEELEHGDTMIALCRFRNGVYCALVCENNVASLFWEIDLVDNPFECAEVWLNQYLDCAVTHEGEFDRYFDQQQITDMFNQYVKSDEYMDSKVSKEDVHVPLSDFNNNQSKEKSNISQEPPRRDLVYSREQVKTVTGWAEDAIRRAFQAGLRRTRKHGRVFVDGADLCDYLTDNITGTN